MEKQILAIGYYHHGQTIIMTGENMNTNIQETNTQYREIPISQLPEYCSMKTQVSQWVKDVNRANIFVVAKSDDLGEWIAYIGYPNLEMIKDEYASFGGIVYACTTISSKEQVLKRGDVLDKESAKQLFPEWSYRRYRE